MYELKKLTWDLNGVITPMDECSTPCDAKRATSFCTMNASESFTGPPAPLVAPFDSSPLKLTRPGPCQLQGRGSVSRNTTGWSGSTAPSSHFSSCDARHGGYLRLSFNLWRLTWSLPHFSSPL